MPVIFLTAFPEHALDAFAVHATGYLLKPVNREKLAAEVAYALSGKQGGAHITARTFGNFDLFVDGDPVTFRQAKCKELLAYLIDRQGSSVTRAEAFAILWEDRMYDRPMQKQLDVIIRSLRETLEEYHIGWIFELKRGTLREIELGIPEDLCMTALKKETPSETVTTEIELTEEKPKAPIDKGAVVGQLVAYENGEKVGSQDLIDQRRNP